MKYIRRILCFVLCVCLLTAGCTDGGNTTGTPTDTAATTTTTTTTTQSLYADGLPAHFIEVLESRQPFTLERYSDPMEVRLSSLLADYQDTIGRYTYVDMDGDDQPELIVEFATRNDLLVMKKDGASYYGFIFGFRSMYQINRDGTFYWTNSAFVNGCARLSFDGDSYECTDLWSEDLKDSDDDEDRYYVNGEPVSKEDYLAAVEEKEEVEWYLWENTADDTPDVLESAAVEGKVTADSAACSVSLKKYRREDSGAYDLYIEVDSGAQVIRKELETNVSALPADSLYLGDVDGDGVQEILVHNNTGGVGGFGLWRVWVLKVEGTDIRILFENYTEFDTGFEIQLLDGYQIEVKNTITDYSLIFDVKEKHREYIDSVGSPLNLPFEVDPFFCFEPADVDDDGISEILCKQYTSCLSHMDYIGTACSVLKYDKRIQMFDVIDTWYEPDTED